MNETEPVKPDVTTEAGMTAAVADYSVYVKQLEKLRAETLGQRETNDAVEDLQRLRAIMMEHAEITLREAKGLLTPDEAENCVHGTDPGQKAIRLARSIRHTIVLTQELLGLRPVPGTRVAATSAETHPADAAERHEPHEYRDTDRERREDFRDREVFDHTNRPVAEVIADIGEELTALTKPPQRKPARRYEPVGHWLAPAGAPGVTPVEYPRGRGPP